MPTTWSSPSRGAPAPGGAPSAVVRGASRGSLLQRDRTACDRLVGQEHELLDLLVGVELHHERPDVERVLPDVLVRRREEGDVGVAAVDRLLQRLFGAREIGAGETGPELGAAGALPGPDARVS